jgi:hypothetical protein
LAGEDWNQKMIIGETPQMLWQRAMLMSALTNTQALPADVYRMLEAYYLNNGLYEATQQALYESGIWTPGMKSLRNPAKRVVEFHVSHIWPGALDKALPLVTDNEKIVDPIQQVWKWSNWGAKKQLASRWFAMFGDWFCKVATAGAPNVSRVFLQNIKPEYVTDFATDERGVVTYIRVDIPGDNGMTHTEVWSKAESVYRLYAHKFGGSIGVNQLGDPVDEKPLSQFGIDFVPFVHAPFLDIGQLRGINAYMLALDKIDETNRMATRLHQLIFRFGKPTVAVMANATDAAGRPLPPPKLGNEASGTSVEHDDDIKSFPGMSKMEYLVAPINYDAHLKAIDAQARELEEDLPELSYYRIKDLGANISGRAARVMLSQAIDRVIESRGNIESALVRADMMALTMGANAGLFKGLGNYAAGDFEHSFAEREVIRLSDFEQAETVGALVKATVPVVSALRRVGWSESELAQMEEDKQSESQATTQSLGQALLAAQRRQDQNATANGQPGQVQQGGQVSPVGLTGMNMGALPGGANGS